jgi:hypothetical protein
MCRRNSECKSKAERCHPSGRLRTSSLRIVCDLKRRARFHLRENHGSTGDEMARGGVGRKALPLPTRNVAGAICRSAVAVGDDGWSEVVPKPCHPSGLGVGVIAGGDK